MQRGRVIKSTGSWYLIDVGEGKQVEARVPGKFRTRGIRTTNPVAVGDWVEIAGESGSYTIDAIEERRNYILRKSVNLSKQSQIIAANLDQAILVATVLEPVTFPAFIDRFCVSAEAFHIPVSIIFNKVDLLSASQRSELLGFASVYADLGYHVFLASAETREGVDAIRANLVGKVSLLSGHSGVGKSTLVNALDSNLDIRVGAVSEAHRTGKHTTTFAEMHELASGGYIVDTPGIRGFGLVDLDKADLAGLFPEMRALLPNCNFYNCLHVKEPGCAVKAALETGQVAQTRYNSYLGMYFDTAGAETYRS